MKQCPRCSLSNIVKSGYDDEATICMACGYTEYAKPKPLPPLTAPDTDYQRRAGRKGALARWFNSAPLTDEDIARMREWREQGRTLQSIALEVGKSISTVHRYLPGQRGAPHLTRRRLNETQRQAIRSEAAAGSSLSALARKYGVSTTAIHKIKREV